MPETEINLPDAEFTSTMQQLVAQAEKTIAATSDFGDRGFQSEAAEGEFATINERLTGLERTLTAGLAKLTAGLPANANDLGEQLQRVDENVVALRTSETVNQRLFNSLHQELKEYRDNFLRDSLQKPFIRDLIVLFDDLSSLHAVMQGASASASGKQAAVGQWSANLNNAIHSLLEILHRMDVNEIEPKEMVDRSIHRVVSYEPADFAEDDGRIVMRLKRGFLWREQVLRPDEVVAKRFG